MRFVSSEQEDGYRGLVACIMAMCGNNHFLLKVNNTDRMSVNFRKTRNKPNSILNLQEEIEVAKDSLQPFVVAATSETVTHEIEQNGRKSWLCASDCSGAPWADCGKSVSQSAKHKGQCCTVPSTQCRDQTLK